ncbi:Ceramide glucosyltransferase, variant 2 [Naganishia albida]|nr:Ceramide glucosyltransferase, variant 2 [Naganishia albida]
MPLLGLSWNPSGASTFKLVLATGTIILWTTVWSICLLGLYSAKKRFTHKPRTPRDLPPPESLPGVTIIRPLRGLDPNLYYNLESTLALDYPRERYEVIFAVQRPDDQALDVVRPLIDKYPEVDARIIVTTEPIGVNPKINNIYHPISQAKYDILWVLDATISVSKRSLLHSVSALTSPSDPSLHPDAEHSALLSSDTAKRDPNDPVFAAEASGVGLVHHVPFAWVPEKSFGARLEQAYLNSTHAKMYLAINATALDSCVVGKSNIYRRSTLSQLESPSARARTEPDAPRGITAFAPYLPEDNMLASGIMHQLHLAHRITADLAMDCLGPVSVGAYVARRVRWIRVRRRMVLAATLVEPLTESLLLGVLASWAFHVLLGSPGWLCFLAHEVAWLIVDLQVMKALKGEGIRSAGDFFDFFTAWLAREALALPIWMRAIVGEEVVWRGVTYKILPSGEAVRVADSMP